ncbi:MAG: twin-arginine translocation signal domain-containing protein, partial [Planctomycetes bacterium]|nr:twin-arginine translocation signal domain-containing protein [Planctomycetota bacterium]
MSISRRRFLETCAAAGGALLAAGPQVWAFKPVSI